MPFDATGSPVDPPRPERPRSNDNIVTALIIVLSLALLVTSMSHVAFVDVVDYRYDR